MTKVTRISGIPGVVGHEPLVTDRAASEELVAVPPLGHGVALDTKSVHDPVTLSPESRAREAAATHPRFGAMSVAAHGDRSAAAQFAYDHAHVVHQPMVAFIDELAGTGPMKYVATGEPVTPESEARYTRQGESLQAESLALYNQELAKGTDAADIFDKLIALVDAQSASFRDIVNWDAKLD